MNKRLLIIIVGLLAVFILFTGCSNELKLNTNYNYSEISFNISKDLKDEDLKYFYPSAFHPEIDTIKELEKCIKDNIDTYYITRITESRQVNVYFNNEIESVKFTQDDCLITINDEIQTYGYIKNENNFSVSDGEKVLYSFYLESGKICYSIELCDGFEVIHSFKN